MAEGQAQSQGWVGFKRRREGVNHNIKPKKCKHLSQKLRDRHRVDIGVAFKRWRALKAEKGLKSDSEVALCLLDV